MFLHAQHWLVFAKVPEVLGPMISKYHIPEILLLGLWIPPKTKNTLYLRVRQIGAGSTYIMCCQTQALT